VDQVTSLHDEKTVRFPDPTGFDPAIDGLSVTSKNFRDLRDSQIFGPTSAARLLMIALLGRSALYFTGEEF
jgi:hypothetical protein